MPGSAIIGFTNMPKQNMSAHNSINIQTLMTIPLNSGFQNALFTKKPIRVTMPAIDRRVK